jgi:hypothetical protein
MHLQVCEGEEKGENTRVRSLASPHQAGPGWAGPGRVGRGVVMRCDGHGHMTCV